MYKIVTTVNLFSELININTESTSDYLRGYNSESYITGEFLIKLVDNRINPLSVSDISDIYCPTRRDLYFRKGKNRISRSRERQTWGRKAGDFIEKFFNDLFLKRTSNDKHDYKSIIDESSIFFNEFKNNRESQINSMYELESLDDGRDRGNTNWLINLLEHISTKEFGEQVLHINLKNSKSLDFNGLMTDKLIEPETNTIGINSPSKPDFVMPFYKIIGDIKTAVSFKKIYLLTCTGYALAYENAFGKGKEIDWGLVYFLQNRNPSEYAKIITQTQIYIFPIDTPLRKWFLSVKDNAYRIISEENPPDFPSVDDRNTCLYCKYKDHCIENGLELSNLE